MPVVIHKWQYGNGKDRLCLQQVRDLGLDIFFFFSLMHPVCSIFSISLGDGSTGMYNVILKYIYQ